MKMQLGKQVRFSKVSVYVLALHICIAGLLFMLVSREQTTDDSKWFQRNFGFHQRIDLQLDGRNVVFVGDSHVQGLCVSCVGPGAVNYGIGKDTTRGVFKRLRRLGSTDKVAAIVIQVGHNDLQNKNDKQIVESYNLIFNNIPPQVLTVFVLQFPVRENADKKLENYNMRKQYINEKAGQFCENRKGCVVLDMSRELTADDGALDGSVDLGDGIHLNETGYRHWIQRLSLILEQQGIMSADD